MIIDVEKRCINDRRCEREDVARNRIKDSRYVEKSVVLYLI